MENTIQKSRTSSRDINFNLVTTTIDNIKSFIKANDYQIKDSDGLSLITESSFNASFSNLSLKKRKRLATSIWAVTNHPTLKNANLFFHFLLKGVMNSDTRVRIIKSDKQLGIESKRKAYKDALAKAKEAYADYKTEKGDFYKIRMAKGLVVG